jgi:hypothetical protein
MCGLCDLLAQSIGLMVETQVKPAIVTSKMAGVKAMQEKQGDQ